MPARGKPGKPRAGFPPFPQSLESPQTRRPSHIPPASTANTYIGEKEASTASRPGLKPSHSRVGQNKLPKWAKISCQRHMRSGSKRPRRVLLKNVVFDQRTAKSTESAGTTFDR